MSLTTCLVILIPLLLAGEILANGCGVKPVEKKIEGRIVGGETAEDVIPWQVGLVKNQQSTNTNITVSTTVPFCGGTIICPRFILTAARCLKFQFLWYKVDVKAEDIEVLAGEYDIAFDLDDATRHQVKHRHIHKNYTQLTIINYDFDFAILELVNPIDLGSGSTARAACLPKPEDYNFDDKTRFVISGWGTNHWMRWYGKPTDKLKQATVEYCSSERGNAFCRGCSPKPFHICTRADQGIGACSGDTGGPLTWIDERTSKVVLVGVFSSVGRAKVGFLGQVITCASHYPDQDPNTYGRVTSVLPWINEITENCQANFD